MDSQLYLTLLFFVGACVAAASTGGIFRPGVWYEDLAKPSWRPPNWLFGPVWALLYAMIAVSGWLIWEKVGWQEAVLPLSLYAIQLILNACWSFIFFGLRKLGLALAEMMLLWLAILATIIVFEPISNAAALMLLPYLVWVSFAMLLNFSIWRLNLRTA